MKIGLDPGIRGCGISVAFRNQIFEATYVRNPSQKGGTIAEVLTMTQALADHLMHKWGNAPGPVTLIIERPQVYTAGKSKGDNNDLLPLYGIATGLAAALAERGPIAECVEYLPREWKGTVDPEEMIRRIRERLTLGEFGKVQLPSNTCDSCRLDVNSLEKAKVGDVRCTKTSCLAHNVYDSVGILLKHLGRLEPVKVIAR